MKQGIHPKYYPNAKVTCACGNTFTTGSTQETLHTEVCSACHPFYTGKQKLLDTTGTVDKFKKRTAVAAQKKSETKVKKPRKPRAKK
ncbi:MAG: 50S ribosomal protein L31 [Patescibacteria group bacterium]|nr:50S ribosomal protein L31 [Patescibacteria group bacterium]